MEESDVIKISHKSLFRFAGFFIAIILVIMFFSFYGTNASGEGISGKIISGANYGNAQVVKLSVEGGKYVLEPSTIKAGLPVRIEANLAEMPGCSKSVSIPAFNIQKNLYGKDNIIEFTPSKAGTFNIACSMNMYKGTFTVLNGDGTKSSYAEKPITGGHTCGSGGCGGCG